MIGRVPSLVPGRLGTSPVLTFWAAPSASAAGAVTFSCIAVTVRADRHGNALQDPCVVVAVWIRAITGRPIPADTVGVQGRLLTGQRFCGIIARRLIFSVVHPYNATIPCTCRVHLVVRIRPPATLANACEEPMSVVTFQALIWASMRHPFRACSENERI